MIYRAGVSLAAGESKTRELMSRATSGKINWIEKTAL